MAINRTPFNALVDDDGSGTTGTPWNKAQIQGVLLDPIDTALNVTTLTGYPGGTTTFLRADGTFASPPPPTLDPVRVLGRSDSGVGPAESLVVGTGLALQGTTLVATAKNSGVYGYTFSSTLTEPPPDQSVRFNAAHPYTAVTKLWVDYHNSNSEDLYYGWIRVDVGSTVLVQDKDNHTQYAEFTTTGAPVDRGAYVELAVTWKSNGTALTNNQDCLVRTTTPAVPVTHHATHEPGGNDALVALSADILTSGTLANGRLAADVVVTSSVAVGTNPAATGAIRLPSSAALSWRSAANDADVAVLRDDDGDVVLSTLQSVNLQLTSGIGTAIEFGTTAVRPSPDNYVNLGQSGTSRWKNLYLGGSLVADGGLASTPLNATNLSSGTVPDARLSTNVLRHTGGYPGGTANFLRADGTFALPPSAPDLAPYTQRTVNETITGTWSFTSPYTNFPTKLYLKPPAGDIAPRLDLVEPAAPADAKNWELQAYGQMLRMLALNEAENTILAGWYFHRNGNFEIANGNLVGGINVPKRDVAETITGQWFFDGGLNIDYTAVPARTPGQWVLGLTGTTLVGGTIGIGDIPSNFTRRDVAESISAAWVYTVPPLIVNNGVTQPPIDGARSAGTRLILWPAASGPEYALGMDGGTMWYDVPAGAYHKFYQGTAVVAQFGDTHLLHPSSGIIHFWPPSGADSKLRFWTSLSLYDYGSAGPHWHFDNAQTRVLDPNAGSLMSYWHSNGYTQIGNPNVGGTLTVHTNGECNLRWGASIYLNLVSGAVDFHISPRLANGTYLHPISDQGAYVGHPSSRIYIGWFSIIGIGVSGRNPSYGLEMTADSAAKPGTSTWTVISDERMKSNIRPVEDALTKVEQVRIIEYDYNGEMESPAGVSGVGVIAQEIEPILPRSVTRRAHDGALVWNAHELLMLNVRATQELAARVAALEARESL
jgi:Chaperone of endosialidase